MCNETLLKISGVCVLVCLCWWPRLEAQVVSNGLAAAGSSVWDFSQAVTLKVPTSSAAAPTLDGVLSFDSLAHNLVWGSNGVTKTAASKSGTIVAGDCVKWDANGNLVDNGAACGVGGVSSVSGTGPIASSGGATPAVSCSTCVTSGAALTNLSLLAGAGSQASKATNLTTDAGLNNLSIAGTITTGTATGSPHGKLALQELPANGSATVGWEAPDTVTAPLSLQFPNAVPAANQIMLFSAPVSGVSSFTWTTFASTTLTDTVNLVRNNQSNAYSTGDQNFGSATSVELPVAAGLTATTNGQIGYDSTGNQLHTAISGADAIIPTRGTAAPTSGNCAKWGANGQLQDNGSACGGGGGGGWNPLDFTVLTLYEPFCPSSNTSGGFGMMGWQGSTNVAAGDQTVTGAGNYPCFYQVPTSASANSVAWLGLGNGARLFGPFSTQTNWTVYLKFYAPASITEAHVRVGFKLTPGGDDDSYFVGARYSSSSGCTANGSDSTWVYVQNDGTTSNTGTGPSITAATEYTLKLSSTVAGTISYSIATSGGSFSTPVAVTGHAPALAIQPVFQTVSCNSTAKTMLVRKWAYQQTGLSY